MQHMTLGSHTRIYRIAAALFFGAGSLLIVGVIIWPKLDLIVSGLFFEPGLGFPLDYNKAFQAAHWCGTYGAWILAASFLVALVISVLTRAPFLKLSTKSWVFLLLALIVGPGLVANAVFKDHWGRARPAQVTEFGGSHIFSPALMPQPDAHRNGSFVAGDPAFGFFLTAFAYVVAGRQRRRVFWGGILAGIAISWLRISMGAHFLSDTLFAALFMLITNALIHTAMFGRGMTRACWREWLFCE